MDVDVLAERILLDLKNTFKKDPLIDEFDVLPVHESVSNKCPVIHVEHKIALEDWCVKHVYVYAYSKFFEWRKKPYKLDSECLLTWATAILLINPEIETVWNTRKEFVCKQVLVLENELKFSELVLSRKPKSAPVYSHRKWILQELNKSHPSPCVLQQIVSHELYVCTRVANLYPNNYYAWSHRIWVLKELCKNCKKVITEELESIEQWTSTHISDHCGFHYRQFLLDSLSDPERCDDACAMVHTNGVHRGGDGANFVARLLIELTYLSNLQRSYPGHETLWYHRRYILHQLHKMQQSSSECFPSSAPCGAGVEEVARCKRYKLEHGGGEISAWNCCKENMFLEESFKLCGNHEWEKNLISRHVKWMNAVLSWPICSERS